MFHTTCTVGEGTPVVKQYYVVKQHISMQGNVYTIVCMYTFNIL